jgi:chloramphenicol 3-O-phosphotransferase
LVAALAAQKEYFKDYDLAVLCASEVTPLPNKQTKTDAYSWGGAPRTIRETMKMPEGLLRNEWMKSIRRELKAFADANTFSHDTMNQDEISTPVMETFKVSRVMAPLIR